MATRSETTTTMATTTDAVAFWWSGEAIGLSLSRATDAASPYTVRWGPGGPLGVTLGVDAAAGAVVVTRSARAGVGVGDVLLRACGLEVRADNVDLAVATLASAHESGGDAHVPLVFARAPAALMVSGVDPRGPLAHAGVSGDMAFELLTVAGRSVRYLGMDELNRLLHASPRPCELRFARRSRVPSTATRRKSDADAMPCQHQPRAKRSPSAAPGAGLAIASVLMVNMV